MRFIFSKNKGNLEGVAGTTFKKFSAVIWKNKPSAAFTILELSIVLVILGLIIGAASTGKAIIRSAQLRTVVTEITGFKTALNTFQETYGALPGDFNDAISYWGRVAGGTAKGADATCQAVVVGSLAVTTTCNGDGDGRITTAETFRVWQHLANAGLISGRYLGVSGSTEDSMPFTKLDKSRAPNSYLLNYLGTPGSATSTCTSIICFPGDYGNVLRLGNGNLPYLDSSGIFTRDAYSIDRKTDDGLPGLGNTRSYAHSGQPNCASSNLPNTADYNLNDVIDKDCNMLFLTGLGNL